MIRVGTHGRCVDDSRHELGRGQRVLLDGQSGLGELEHLLGTTVRDDGQNKNEGCRRRGV